MSFRARRCWERCSGRDTWAVPSRRTCASAIRSSATRCSQSTLRHCSGAVSGCAIVESVPSFRSAARPDREGPSRGRVNCAGLPGEVLPRRPEHRLVEQKVDGVNRGRAYDPELELGGIVTRFHARPNVVWDRKTARLENSKESPALGEELPYLASFMAKLLGDGHGVGLRRRS